VTFWEHLDELRGVIIRCLIVSFAAAVIAFCFREAIFWVVLYPKGNLELINTGLTGQFIIHMRVAFYIGLITAMPYVLYQLFHFISPGLYTNERKVAIWLVISGYIFFMLGVAFCYFIVFPITVHFLGNYQVSGVVQNLISLESYVDTLALMSLVLGVVFEIPVICWLLGRIGMLKRHWMQCYRRHVIVVLLIVAAIITPTTDAITLLVVALPMYILYELSIFLVPKSTRKKI